MRISTNLGLAGFHGRRNFLRRLFVSMKDRHGIKVVDAKSKPDVHLIVIQGDKIPAAKNIVRIDGVYYDRPRLQTNQPIKRTVLQSDGVIFQSNFSKSHAQAILKVAPSKSVVIHNGASAREVADSPPHMALRKGYDRLFVACAHWLRRPSKRFTAIARAFVKANQQTSLRLKFVVIGRISPRERLANPSIAYLGDLSPDQVIGVYKACDYMIHVSHIDSCPNAVIEGLISGLPVLCNNLGGTPEIVGDSGIVSPLDKLPYKFGTVFRSEEEVGSKSINNTVLSRSILEICKKQKSDWDIQRPDLEISAIADQYYGFFKRVLGS